MSDEAKYLLSRLDQTLDDLRTFTRWVVGLVIAFATTLVTAKKSDEMISSFPSKDSVGLLAIILLFLTLYYISLYAAARGARDLETRLLVLAGPGNDASGSPEISHLLASNHQLRGLRWVALIRVAVPTIVLLVCWGYLADIIDSHRASGARQDARLDPSAPTTKQIGATPLVQNGAGPRPGFYNAALYVESPSKDAETLITRNSAWLVELKVTADNLSAEDVRARMKSRLKANSAKRKVDLLDGRIDALVAQIPALRKGDTLSVVHVPGVGTSIVVNDRGWPLPGRDLATVVLASWLDPDPSDPDFKSLQDCLLGRCPR